MMKLIATMLAVAATQVPGPNDPFPADWRAHIQALSPAQVDRLWTASQRYCGAPARQDAPATCRVFQLAAIGSLDSDLWQLGWAHHDRRFIDDMLNRCRRLYRDNGSGDARILDECLGHGLYVVMVGDDIARSDGEDRGSWRAGAVSIE